MKRFWLLLSVMVLLAATPTWASDITDALYHGEITVSNNGTATTKVVAAMTLNSELLNTNFNLAGDFSDVAIRDSSGNDIAFGPSVNTTYPWSLWVASIGADTSQTLNMYSGNVTGGKIRYFPGAAGMTTDDSATLELGDNWTMEWSGYLDAATAGNLVRKDSAITVSSGASGNVTASIPSIIEASYTTNDDNGQELYAANWEGQTFITGSRGFEIDKVSLKIYRLGTPGTLTAHIRATAAGLPTGSDLTSGTINGDALATTPGDWYDIDLTNKSLSANTTYAVILSIAAGDINNYVGWRKDETSPSYASGSRVVSANSGVAWAAQASDDLMFKVYSAAVTLTTTGVASGEHTVKVQQDGALLLDGTDDYVLGPTTTALNPRNNLTVLAWIRVANGVTTRGGVYTKADAVASGLAYEFSKNTDGKMSWYDPNLGWKYSNTAVNDGNLHLVGFTGTQAANGGKFYLDGVADGQFNYTTVPEAAASDLRIGRTYTGTSWLNGYISEVMVFSRVLSAAEQLAYFNTMTGIDTTSLVGRWTFDDGTGTTAADSSGHGYNGSIYNGGGLGATWLAVASLWIDDTREDMDVSAAVPDNAEDYYFLENYAMPYMESQEITIDGVQQQYIEWEYGTTFNDQSPGGLHDATPSFRTTSSDADVSASLTAMGAITLAASDALPSSSWPSMITSVPTQPATTYTEDTHPGFFFEPLVRKLLAVGNVPDAFFWTNFCFFIILLAGMLAYRIHPSLMIKAITMLVLMIWFATDGLNVYGQYVSLYFAFYSFGVIVISRSYGI